jgi:hypothetical protein
MTPASAIRGLQQRRQNPASRNTSTTSCRQHRGDVVQQRGAAALQRHGRAGHWTGFHAWNGAHRRRAGQWGEFAPMRALHRISRASNDLSVSGTSCCSPASSAPGSLSPSGWALHLRQHLLRHRRDHARLRPGGTEPGSGTDQPSNINRHLAFRLAAHPAPSRASTRHRRPPLSTATGIVRLAIELGGRHQIGH